MIYAKIYLDKDSDGTDVLVFDSYNGDESAYITKAGKRPDFFATHYYVTPRTTIHGLSSVAISPEAREIFGARIEDTDSYDTAYYVGDFDLSLVSGGIFAFMPDDIKKAKDDYNSIPSSEECGTARRLRADEKFVFCTKYGDPRKEHLSRMIEAENVFLKEMDLSTPVDEDILYDMYFTKKRAAEGEPPYDAETIRNTPAKYLTEAQRTVIRAEYKSYLNRYNSQEWHDNGDYIYAEIIIPHLMNEYCKSCKDIEDLLNISENDRIS